jgi:putative nucleotidyltransferase with HDIG domain
VKMFTGPQPARALDWLDRTGLLKEVLPEIEALKGVEQPKEFHPEGDVYVHTRMMLGFLKNPDPVLAFGCLLHDIGKPATQTRTDRIRFNGHDRVGARMTEAVMDRLKFSNEIKGRVTACVEWHMQFKDVKAMRPATLKRMFQRETFGTELEQHRYDCLASHGDLSAWRFARRRFRELSAQDIRPEPFLKGRDLIDLGMNPGPEMGKILKEAEELQLEGQFRDNVAAVDWVRKRIQRR